MAQKGDAGAEVPELRRGDAVEDAVEAERLELTPVREDVGDALAVDGEVPEEVDVCEVADG